ncbi:MAG: hypothetical protein NVS3B25_33910 [Hymenobacter sp.]
MNKFNLLCVGMALTTAAASGWAHNWPASIGWAAAALSFYQYATATRPRR